MNPQSVITSVAKTASPLLSPSTPVSSNSGWRWNPLAILDSIGGTISFACAVHCLLLPFIVTLLPLLGLTFLAHSVFEVFMISLSLTLATASFCWGSRVHGEWKTILFVAAAAVLFFFGHEASGAYHWTFMGIGGLALASGHYLNHRLCQTCTSCDDH